MSAVVWLIRHQSKVECSGLELIKFDPIHINKKAYQDEINEETQATNYTAGDATEKMIVTCIKEEINSAGDLRRSKKTQII